MNERISYVYSSSVDERVAEKMFFLRGGLACVPRSATAVEIERGWWWSWVPSNHCVDLYLTLTSERGLILREVLKFCVAAVAAMAGGG